MNRSILIVICDFLLLSLLTFSTDINRMADENTRPPVNVTVATNEVANAGQDLATVMKLALEEERKGHVQLQQQLAAAREAANRQQAQLNAREQEYQQLQQQYATAQTNIETLNRQMQEHSAQSQQQLAAIQAEAQRQSELAAALRWQLEQLGKSNLLALAERQQLIGKLQIAEVEKNAATQRATYLQQEAQAERVENVKLAEGFKSLATNSSQLAEGVKTLATNSSQLAEEIRENRALAPNTIFSEFVSNRIGVDMLAERSGFLGVNSSKNKQAETVLATDGTNTFALCHVQDTPLTLWDPGTDWDSLTGALTGHGARVDIHWLLFHRGDPRVVMMPVSAADVSRLGGRVYRISANPYKFQDAVLVGADEGYYGECNFQIDLNTPQYVKLDHSLFRGLFGKFNPSRGDLVFSRTGELLGIMVNSTYCLMIHNFAPAATIQFGPDVRSQHTGSTLAELYFNIFQLPLRLQ